MSNFSVRFEKPFDRKLCLIWAMHEDWEVRGFDGKSLFLVVLEDFERLELLLDLLWVVVVTEDTMGVVATVVQSESLDTGMSVHVPVLLVWGILVGRHTHTCSPTKLREHLSHMLWGWAVHEQNTGSLWLCTDANRSIDGDPHIWKIRWSIDWFRDHSVSFISVLDNWSARTFSDPTIWALLACIWFWIKICQSSCAFWQRIEDLVPPLFVDVLHHCGVVWPYQHTLTFQSG